MDLDSLYIAKKTIKTTICKLFRDLREKTITDKLVYIANVDTQNYPSCRSQLVVEKFKHSTLIQQPIKITSVVKPIN